MYTQPYRRKETIKTTMISKLQLGAGRIKWPCKATPELHKIEVK